MTLVRSLAVLLLALSSIASSYDGNHRICRRATSGRSLRGRTDQQHHLARAAAQAADAFVVSGQSPQDGDAAEPASSALPRLFLAESILPVFVFQVLLPSTPDLSASPRGPPAA